MSQNAAISEAIKRIEALHVAIQNLKADICNVSIGDYREYLREIVRLRDALDDLHEPWPEK